MIEILEADITTLDVDAIVNAANAELWPGGGVDGAIHEAAGPGLREEVRRRHPDGCPTGDAVATGGHALPARYVIHAVGPQWGAGGPDRDELLERTYRSAFARARELGDVRTIAFPAISTGIYRFPKDRAAAIALRVMREEEAHFDRIVVALYGEENVRLYERLRGAG